MELGLSATATVIALVSAVLSLFTFCSTRKRDQKRDTLEAYNRLQEQVFDELNLLRPEEIEEIVKNNRSAEYKKISGYLARIEHFCVGVNTKIYDFKTVYELGHGYIDGHQIKKRIVPIIDRKQSGTQQDYYENIHKLLKNMDKETERRSKNGRP